jgi:hypothetical protein
MSQLLPGGSANLGHVLLGLVAVAHSLQAPNDAAAQFLRGLVGDALRFPDIYIVPHLLEGIATETEILRAIGVPATHETPDANIDLDGDGQNDFRVEPMTARGEVSADTATVRRLPGSSEAPIGSLALGDSVAIIGCFEDWYAIDSADAVAGTAFVLAAEVVLT